jgi:23S rRNA pseudouridine1911/1915/1917 synthase
VPESFEGRPGRLDAVLAALSGVSRTRVRRAIEEGRVTVDGVPRSARHRLAGGERLAARLDPPLPPEPEGPPVPVRWEDEHLAIVAKPAGLVTHPTERRRTGTLVNRLLGMGTSLSTLGGPDRAGIVHRLDAGTSGLLVVAKDDEAHRLLAAMFRRHEVERRYVALVRGDPDHDGFTVEAPLGRRAARIVVDRVGGRSSETSFEVLERFDVAALVAATPRTGRTHQIRVHLAAVGLPIVGDRAYGGGGGLARHLGLDRPFLHAARLGLRHPVTGERIDVEEPLPGDLAAALRRLRDLRP